MSQEEYVAPLIVKDRLRKIAKGKGKVLGSDFLEMLDKKLRADVEEACHFIGNKKIVRVKEYLAHKTLVDSASR